ncbi:NmrA-like family protein [Coleophoma cylindrospora]|uniref:NmrA-like family protein n=1 Tax=Coleophoma cylindrospora TaxID=1849047 RepID=A0A3D8RFT1_9HELO|nr:NmrA-like family protein [Coleophoma cylindrospora]
MTSIKNVAVLGAGGNLGPSIVEALLDAKFNVTVLSRHSSTNTFPSAVQVRKVDYNSESSLIEDLRGQDAVVSVLGSAGLASQKTVVDAAVKAGVQRFIPSEFGVDTQALEGSPLATLLKDKTDTTEYLKNVSSQHTGFSWTGIATNLFFDWGLRVGSLGFSIPNKTATIIDSGNEPFFGTNLKAIGLAVVSVLQHPETSNRYLRVSSFTTTQNELLSILESESGGQWTVSKEAADERRKTGEENLAKGDRSAFGNLLKDFVFRDGSGHGSPVGGFANKELGLPEEVLKETIKNVLK